jgi:hypothetical protein
MRCIVLETAWVMNASPLILYARIRRLDLIEDMAEILSNVVDGDLRSVSF